MPGLGKNYCPLGKVDTALWGRSDPGGWREGGDSDEARMRVLRYPSSAPTSINNFVNSAVDEPPSLVVMEVRCSSTVRIVGAEIEAAIKSRTTEPHPGHSRAVRQSDCRFAA